MMVFSCCGMRMGSRSCAKPHKKKRGDQRERKYSILFFIHIAWNYSKMFTAIVIQAKLAATVIWSVLCIRLCFIQIRPLANKITSG
jgi:hypothetical protein